MRILDVNGNEVLNPNYSLGYVVEEKMFIEHHDAVEAVEEVGHYEVISEYPNGGKDVEWVVDVEAVEAVEAWDEYEDILRYIEYTEEELAEIKKAEEEAYKNSPEYRISELEAMLNALLGVAE